MIRRWRMAFWALSCGTTVVLLSCLGCTSDGGSSSDLASCQCTVPCGEGQRSWSTAFWDLSLDEATENAEEDCNAYSFSLCDDPPTDDCECTCERD